jgi:hypothetical protein
VTNSELWWKTEEQYLKRVSEARERMKAQILKGRSQAKSQGQPWHAEQEKVRAQFKAETLKAYQLRRQEFLTLKSSTQTIGS